jgi:hypothetical protein
MSTNYIYGNNTVNARNFLHTSRHVRLLTGTIPGRMLLASLSPGDECMEHVVTRTRKKLHAARSVQLKERV